MKPPRQVPMLPWPADAALVMPGSKSAANRLLIAAAALGSPVELEGASPSDDVQHLVAGLRTLGHDVAFDAAAERIRLGARPPRPPAGGTLLCGNAGTALRFLVSLAAITPGDWTIDGDEAMRRRPIGPLTAAWRQLGIDAHDHAGCPPVRVRGGVPSQATVLLDASASSQFLSSLLLVGAALPFPLHVRLTGELASRDYAALTLRTLAQLGVQATSTQDREFTVSPHRGPVPGRIVVDGDWSSMGMWTCLQHLTGSRVRAANLPADSGQADERLADVLRAMPATGEHTIDVAAMPDQFLDLAIVAAHRAGTTRLVGGRNLRVKESDRIAVMARELTKLGARVDERADGLVVHGGRPLRPGVVDPHGDHRVAMAFALAGLLSPGIAIAEPDCVTKSYPHFWRDLDNVVGATRCVAVIGMRGAGKSTFARSLAARTGRRWIDSDALFVAAHGEIAPFVAAHGWPAFRREEARLVADALQPGAVVSTGGGAIESDATRALLHERALVVWLEAPAPVLRTRLGDGALRPSLTGREVADEIVDVLAHREPLYRALADVRLDALLPTAAMVDAALVALGTRCRWPGTATKP